MKYGSVCSGIEAATAAWHDLGWKPQFFSEIEKFPSAVLKHHYPDVLNHGDMEKFNEWSESDIDVLVGGTPCQSFSVAGLREGMADPRGNLALTYLALADRYAPPWIVWENVPGVLSSGEGRDFGSFLGGLAELGYGWAYRVLDAQYFGVPQRRRRVFVVGYLGDWRPAVQVLFERESLFRHPAPSREQGEGVATNAEERPRDSSEEAYVLDRASYNQGENAQFDPEISPIERGSPALTHHSTTHLVANSLNGNSGRQQIEQTYVPEVSPAIKACDYKGPSSDGDGDGLPVIAFQHNAGMEADGYEDVSPTMKSGGGSIPAIAFDTTQVTSKTNRPNPQPGDPCHTLAKGANPPAIAFKPAHYTRGRGGAPDEVVPPLTAEANMGDTESVVLLNDDKPAGSLAAIDNTSGEGLQYAAASKHILPVVFETRYARNGRGAPDTVAPPLKAQSGQTGKGDAAPVVAFTQAQTGDIREGDVHSPLLSHPQSETSSTQYGIRMVVRRLTPMECERLQGFPDGYTKIPWRGKAAEDCPNGPRYKALGNSMAVPVMRWIGERIQMVASED